MNLTKPRASGVLFYNYLGILLQVSATFFGS
jgi:hypothetical protein